jgi:hypothetical protein
MYKPNKPNNYIIVISIIACVLDLSHDQSGFTGVALLAVLPLTSPPFSSFWPFFVLSLPTWAWYLWPRVTDFRISEFQNSKHSPSPLSTLSLHSVALLTLLTLLQSTLILHSSTFCPLLFVHSSFSARSTSRIPFFRPVQFDDLTDEPLVPSNPTPSDRLLYTSASIH